MMPELLLACQHSVANVREGYLSLFIFLPKAFGDRFGQHVARALPVIVKGLADDMEAVRDCALRAAQVWAAGDGWVESGTWVGSGCLMGTTVQAD